MSVPREVDAPVISPEKLTGDEVVFVGVSGRVDRQAARLTTNFSQLKIHVTVQDC